MKRLLSLVSVTSIALVSALLWVPTVAQAESAVGSISGRVILPALVPAMDEVAPCIWVERPGTTTVESGCFDFAATDGTFTVTGLAPGAYSVRVVPTGPATSTYYSRYYGGTYEYQTAVFVNVGAGQDVTGIDVVLAPGGSITGLVEGEGPPEFVCVGAADRFDCLTTGGTYVLGGLPPGPQLVTFNGAPTYRAEFFDGSSAEATASLVEVRAGQTVENVDAQLQLLGQAAVGGVQVTVEPSTARVGQQVTITARISDDGVPYDGAGSLVMQTFDSESFPKRTAFTDQRLPTQLLAGNVVCWEATAQRNGVFGAFFGYQGDAVHSNYGGFRSAVVEVRDDAPVVPAPSCSATQPPRIDLQVSAAPDRSAAADLDGSRQVGSVYIFVDDEDAIAVEFRVDGRRRNTERAAPWDLLGTVRGVPRALDTSGLRPGSHVVTAVITKADGSVELTSATFTAGASVGVATDILVSANKDRSSAQPLRQAALPQRAFIFVDTPATRVTWFLDGRQVQVERTAPWDFAGSRPGGATAFDTTRLRPGPHEITAIIMGTGGSSSAVVAAFDIA